MARINIKGAIVPNEDKPIYDFFGLDAVCPADVEKEIAAANGGALEVIINSAGGDVFASSEIYTALKSCTGGVETRIVGVAASGASVIAMAGNPVRISPTAELMIHNVSGQVSGDHRAVRAGADMLEGYNSTIANAYMLKSGMAKEKLLKLMAAETWLTPEQALAYGLVDEIMFTDPVRLAASGGGLLPPEVITKTRNSLQAEASFYMQKAQARQNLLKLKGESK